MKKIYLIFVLTVGFLFTNCEFMCIKTIHNSYLILYCDNFSDYTVSCKSEKLFNDNEFTFLEEIKSERDIEYLIENNLLNSSLNYKVFIYTPRWKIEDYKDVNLEFKFETNSELYTGELYIPTLKTKSDSYVEGRKFTMKTEDGKIVEAMFTFYLDFSL